MNGPTRTLVAAACAGGIALASAAAPRAQRPRASPHESITATVDGAEMSIVYGRPYTRGRTIFGDLVPYGRVWCPGADEATMLTTSRPLRIGDLSLAAGEYSLWILPTDATWTLIVSRDAHVFHTQYRSSGDLGRIEMTKRTLPSLVEQLTFSIEKNASGPGGRIVMAWATTEVGVPFTVQ
jgi:hypothetical protein